MLTLKNGEDVAAATSAAAVVKVNRMLGSIYVAKRDRHVVAVSSRAKASLRSG